MDNIKKAIGKRVKELRRSRKWTQEQFAEKIDIDQRTLSAVECGINFPTKHFIKIAKAFDIELKELFDFEHIEITEDKKRKDIKTMVDKLEERDLNIVYKLVKTMLI